jgi:diguanylate cyclase (GGDEF)-like protein/PAS domain S-box-containing protein
MSQHRFSRKHIVRKVKGWKDPYSQTRHKFAQQALLHTEAMLIEAQRISHVGSWVWDLTTDKIQFSEEMYRLVGLLPEAMEITRDLFANFLHPSEAELVLWEFQHGASYPFSNIEHQIVLPNGETRIAHTRIKAYKDEKGNSLRLLGSTQDITERRQTEEALKESEWRNRIVSELITDYIFVVDVESDGALKLRWTSENMYRMTGRRLEDAATPDLWKSIIHPDDSIYFFGFVDYILSTAKAGELECRSLLNQGEERWVRIFARPQVDEGNNLTSIVGAIQDITERKHAEESLRMAEADYRAIFEGAPLGIFRSTVEGRFLKVNLAMAEMYGYHSPEEMIVDVKSIAKQIYTEPILRQKFACLLAEQGEVFGFESLDRHKDGSAFWTSMNARMVKNAAGENMYYEGFVIDITARKESEVALQKMNGQLRVQLDEIKELQAILHDQAIHDQLTGLYNRHYLQEFITQEYARAVRKEYPISLIVLDLDHLKEINSKYGHFTGGDIALQTLGRHLKTMSRVEDVVCRYGGDEFLIVMHNTPAHIACERAEQWRKSLVKMEIDSNDIKFNISFSAGIASFPTNGQDIEEVMQAADKALYQAKEMGRNCVVVFSV